ncbi:MAG: ribosome silencing factor [Alphaproteobacteria bacterium]|nr:MAG: ribosome silencing factor [Alphaproteobacteria bacterium]
MPGAGAESARCKEDTILSHTAQTVRDATVGEAAVAAAEPHTPSSEALLERVLSSLEDDKAETIVSIDLRGKSEVADYMVVCSGRSTRQVVSIAEKLVERLKQSFRLSSKVEGKDVGDWVLIDAGDVIVHVFRPEIREFYQLEKMWMAPAAQARARA